MNSQDVNMTNIQDLNLIFIFPPTSPSAADGKAGEARPWWESPAGECHRMSPQTSVLKKSTVTLNLKHRRIGELVCVTSSPSINALLWDLSVSQTLASFCLGILFTTETGGYRE